MAVLEYPDVETNPGFWINPRNWWESRRKFMRRDNSNDWRKSFLGDSLRHHPDRSIPFSDLLPAGADPAAGFRIAVLGDTGEGDRSQYGLLPLIRALAPQMLILNGDVAYPAGNEKDFLRGFFRPYRNLGIPIWAVPGNHEYYSGDKGRTFFQVFCTHRYAGWWAEHGIPLVPQPGTYWELRDPSGKLAILAVDTGMAGDLDGAKRSHDEDRIQHEWLRNRLARCEADGVPAVVLFHIPALVHERHQSDTHLSNLHRILAASPAVRLVLCGHIHNHQYYRPETFREYLRKHHQAGSAGGAGPHYIVSGGGGAYLGEPRTAADGHRAEFFFPDAGQWKEYSGKVEWAVSKVGLRRAAMIRIASAFNSSLRADADAARYMSLVLIDVGLRGAEARHLLMDDLQKLFRHLDPGAVVQVDHPRPPVDPGAVRELLAAKEPIALAP